MGTDAGWSRADELFQRLRNAGATMTAMCPGPGGSTLIFAVLGARRVVLQDYQDHASADLYATSGATTSEEFDAMIDRIAATRPAEPQANKQTERSHDSGGSSGTK